MTFTSCGSMLKVRPGLIVYVICVFKRTVFRIPREHRLVLLTIGCVTAPKLIREREGMVKERAKGKRGKGTETKTKEKWGKTKEKKRGKKKEGDIG